MTGFIAYITNSMGSVIVEAPYHEVWIRAIRSVVPVSARKNARNTWKFKADYYLPVATITQAYFLNTHDTYLSHPGPLPREPKDWEKKWFQFQQKEATRSADRVNALAGSDNYAALYVTHNAPVEVIKAAYRALSKLYHPDTGGDAEDFKRINEAYSALLPQAPAEGKG